MTAKKTKKATAAKPRKTGAKKSAAPARKVVVVDKPSRGVTPTPIDRRTGKPYRAPKLVRRKPLTREEQAALDHSKIRGNS